MTGGLAKPPLSPTGLLKRPTCRTEANKKLQKDIYYFIAVVLLLIIFLIVYFIMHLIIF
jgi:hypothetical protein